MKGLDGGWPQPVMAQAIALLWRHLFLAHAAPRNLLLIHLNCLLWSELIRGLLESMWVVLSHSAVSENSRWQLEDSNLRRPSRGECGARTLSTQLPPTHLLCRHCCDCWGLSVLTGASPPPREAGHYPCLTPGTHSLLGGLGHGLTETTHVSPLRPGIEPGIFRL